MASATRRPSPPPRRPRSTPSGSVPVRSAPFPALGPLATLVLAPLLLALASCQVERVPEDLPEAEVETLVGPNGEVSWDRYHTYEESNRILRAFEDLYPDLARVRVIGESYRGRDLTLMEVTNRNTGPPEEKPALYLDGGIHAQELTGSEVALYVMAHLLNGYGDDPEITELLDTRTFYIRPKFNPDGSDLVLEEDQWLRSTPRPVDTNGDGIPDSDPPEDLDGDGKILSMRVEDPDGEWVKDPDDPRIMHEREDHHEGPFYRILREGLDRNGDGVINSDGVGGIDMNRNFPRNWERWHLQPGSGDFPLSEPETHAAATFINEHRNIGSIVHGHTSGGFIFRLPSAMDPREFDENDEALVLAMGQVYTDDTGRPVIPSATHPVERRYGTLIQWGYTDQGIVGWVPEYSPPPEEWVPDYGDTGEVTEADWHRFNEEELGGRYFTDWTPYDHPQLGEVEIGGWHTKYWGQNPPHPLLERELEVQVPWILWLARQLPRLELDAPAVTELDGGRFRVEARVRNTGWLATHLTDRGHVGRIHEDGTITHQVVAPPLAIIEAEGAVVEEPHHRIRIRHLAGSNPHTTAVDERERTVSWTVRREGPDASVRVVVESDKGGTVRSEAVELR